MAVSLLLLCIASAAVALDPHQAVSTPATLNAGKAPKPGVVPPSLLAKLQTQSNSDLVDKLAASAVDKYLKERPAPEAPKVEAMKTKKLAAKKSQDWASQVVANIPGSKPTASAAQQQKDRNAGAQLVAAPPTQIQSFATAAASPLAASPLAAAPQAAAPAVPGRLSNEAAMKKAAKFFATTASQKAAFQAAQKKAQHAMFAVGVTELGESDEIAAPAKQLSPEDAKMENFMAEVESQKAAARKAHPDQFASKKDAKTAKVAFSKDTAAERKMEQFLAETKTQKATFEKAQAYAKVKQKERDDMQKMRAKLAGNPNKEDVELGEGASVGDTFHVPSALEAKKATSDAVRNIDLRVVHNQDHLNHSPAYVDAAWDAQEAKIAAFDQSHNLPNAFNLASPKLTRSASTVAAKVAKHVAKAAAKQVGGKGIPYITAKAALAANPTAKKSKQVKKTAAEMMQTAAPKSVPTSHDARMAAAEQQRDARKVLPDGVHMKGFHPDSVSFNHVWEPKVATPTLSGTAKAAEKAAVKLEIPASNAAAKP